MIGKLGCDLKIKYVLPENTVKIMFIFNFSWFCWQTSQVKCWWDWASIQASKLVRLKPHDSKSLTVCTMDTKSIFFALFHQVFWLIHLCFDTRSKICNVTFKTEPMCMIGCENPIENWEFLAIVKRVLLLFVVRKMPNNIKKSQNRLIFVCSYPVS